MMKTFTLDQLAAIIATAIKDDESILYSEQ